MSIELKQAAQQAVDAFDAFGDDDDFASLFALAQKMRALHTAIQQAEAQQPSSKEHLFELWWEAHMPNATQEQAWTAFTAAVASSGVGIAAQQPATGEPVVEPMVLYNKVESKIVQRYVVEKRTGGGFWPYCVRACGGECEIFVGHKVACENVRAALQTACLDGAFMAGISARSHPAPSVFLVRDIASLLGASVPDVCNALAELGYEPRRSTNAAISPDEALAVASRLRPAPSVLKDDQIAAMVNKVHDIARMFNDHQSLRERIAIELVPALKVSQEVKSNAERGRFLVGWLKRFRLLQAEFGQMGAGEKPENWWLLHAPWGIDKTRPFFGHGKTPEQAIDAAMLAAK